MGANNKCCCTCAEMFAGFSTGATVNVDVVAGPGGSRTITGTLGPIEGNTVIINETSPQRRTRVCCAYIVSVFPVPAS